jgi:iron(III) transport system substrate-binding protein
MRKLIAALTMTTYLLSAPSFAHEHEHDHSKMVNLYSAQQEYLIRPLLDDFTKDTGIKVNLITGEPAALITRLEREGKDSPADLMLTADIGNLYQAEKRGLLKSVVSKVLEKNIPTHLRDSAGKWFGLTMRSRVLFARKNEMPKDPIHYLDLASPTWKGKVLIRSSDNIYNQSLLSYMIYHFGEEKATEWARGVVANMARPPQGGDRDQLTALAAGEGGIAVSNTYYYGMLVAGKESDQNAKVKETVGMVFPDQDKIGAHVNIRGGGVLNSAKHEENAIKLMEYLSEEKAQQVFADANFEYPVHQSVKPSSTIAAWGDFKKDTTPLEKIAELQPKAIAIMDAVGWK